MIPTYNQEAYIAQAIESALMQDYENLEVVVADDCSTDKTGFIAKQYTTDSRLKYFCNNKNLGRIGNYHHTLYTHITGDWVINLDGDDYYTDNTFISRAISLICSKDNVVCYFGKKYISPHLKRYSSNRIGPNTYFFNGIDYLKNYFKIGGFAHMGTLYRRDAAIADGQCYTFNGLQSDFHAIIRLCVYGNIIISQESGYLWRVHNNNASNSLDYKTKYSQEIECQRQIMNSIGYIFTPQEKNKWLHEGNQWAKHDLVISILYNIHTFNSLLLGIKHFKFNKSYIIIYTKAAISTIFRINLFQHKRNLKELARILRIKILHIFTLSPRLITLDNLLIAPHPDDEIIGCAGLIQQTLKAGKKIDVVILTGGGKSYSNCCNVDEDTLIEARRKLSRKAAQIIGLPLEHLHFLNYPDGGISYENKETERLKQLIEELSPEAIFIPHKGEGWSDHVEVGNIIRKLNLSGIQLYEYCVWFWYYNVWNIDWKNACVVKMNREEHQRKLKAMDAYITPLAPCGKPWSGVLPKVFVKANQWNKELYFKG